jgi:hypothetical protein
VLAPVAAPGPTALAATALGRVVTAGLSRASGTTVVSAVRAGFNSIRNDLGRAAEQTAGNQIVSSLAGPSMRAHATEALAGQGLSRADLALMQQMHAETMASLQTNAATWNGFRQAYWTAARQTPAFAQLFPTLGPGSGAPSYVAGGTNFGRLNLHHLNGRIRDLMFCESNLMLVPNALDTPFLHSAQYLTGTQQELIRRGLRTLFPRQWTQGGLGATVAQLLPGEANGFAPPTSC